MKERNIIGKRIKFLRKRLGLTQEELLAKLQTHGLEIDRPMISKIENGNREILDFEIKTFSIVLNVSIEELFKE